MTVTTPGARVVKTRGNYDRGAAGTVAAVRGTTTHPKYGTLTTIEITLDGGGLLVTEADLCDLLEG